MSTNHKLIVGNCMDMKEMEDKEKVLRIIYEEFSRDYLSDIK